MDKKRHQVWLVLVVLLLSRALQAQPQIGLRLGFNAESNRYEVYGRANFTAQGYSWGPSQVSVVLPCGVINGPLGTRSSQAGLWLDQSQVYGRSASAMGDYHGITTQGGKVDVEAGVDQLLFDFRLPVGYVEGVRLYDVSRDPSSSRAGMQGGDFRSYVSNERGSVRVVSDSRPASLSVQVGASALAEVSRGVLAYPNPAVGGKCWLYFKGFLPSERVRVEVWSVSGVLLRSHESRVVDLLGQSLGLGDAGGGYVLVTVRCVESSGVYSQKVWLP